MVAKWRLQPAQPTTAQRKSRWRNWILPAIGPRRVHQLTDRDLQEITNVAYAAGRSRKVLKLLAADLRAFCKYCRKAKLSAYVPEELKIPRRGAVQRQDTGGRGSVFRILNEQHYYKRWKTYCAANGLTPCSLYELRHTFVSVVKTLPAGGSQGAGYHSADMDTFGIYSHTLTGDAAHTAQGGKRCIFASAEKRIKNKSRL